MGDRANIQIRESEGGKIYFYTHWSGTELPNILAKALDRGRDRWGDEQYLSRVIFSEMIKNDILETTGFGISTYRGDDNHPDLIVDYSTNKITDRSEEILDFESFIEKYNG